MNLSNRPTEDRVLIIMLAAVLGLTLILMGGRHIYGGFVYTIGVIGTGSVWSVLRLRNPESRLRSTGVEWIILFGAGLLILQVVPLPTAILLKLKPGMPDRLPAWFLDHSASPGTWSTLSYAPQETLENLALFLAHGTLFLLFCQLIRSREDVAQLLTIFSGTVVVVAVFALTQHVFGNGKFFWIYDYPLGMNTEVTLGPFSCPNHLGQFLALGIPSMCWLTFGTKSTAASERQSTSNSGWGNKSAIGTEINPRTMLCGGALLLTMLVGVMTLSRGAMLSVGFASFAGLAAFLGRGMSRGRWLIIGGFAAVLLSAVAIFGFGRITEELATLGSPDIDKVSGPRADLYRAVLAGSRAELPTGVGAGGHVFAYETWLTNHHPSTFRYSESGYLQVLFETGMIGLGLLLVGVITAITWIVRVVRSDSQRTRTLGLCCGIAVIVSLLQSLFDFIWYVPGTLFPVLIMLACLRHLSLLTLQEQLAEEEHESAREAQATPASIPGPRIAGIAVAAVLIISTAFSFQTLLPEVQASASYDNYKRLAYRGRDGVDPERTSGASAERAALLREVVAASPNDAHAHFMLADSALFRLDHQLRTSSLGMNLSEIRDSLRGFDDPQKGRAWLEKAILDDEAKQTLDEIEIHTHAAINNCPLIGDAWITLAIVEQLRGRPQGETLFLRQAYQVRPHSPSVHVAIAEHLSANGKQEVALRWWAKAYSSGPKYQAEITRQIAPAIGAKTFIQTFRPATNDMSRLAELYLDLGQIRQEMLVRRHLANQLEREAENRKDSTLIATQLLQASGQWEKLHEHDAAIRCMEAAIAHVPQSWDHHKAHALLLTRLGMEEKAMDEIRWCLRRKPDDAAMKNMLRKNLQMANQLPESRLDSTRQ